MYQRLVLLFLCLCMTSMLMAQQAFDIHVDFDECISNFGGDNMDYSEFQTSGQTCTSLSISENGIYRRNPEVNKHSCTPGVGNTPGMCVEADQTCEYLADSDRAIRFEVIVDASAQNPAGIRKIEFYQKSPVFYNWINGAAGINNIPKRYSVRVTVGGNEIYRMQDLYTTASWAKRSFDFSQVAEFVVTENTTFSFELTAYCPINNGSEISVWDIDELSIYDLNSNEGIDGGTLTGGPFAFDSVGDGTPDMLEAGSITLANAQGANSQWIITDDEGYILGLPPMPGVVDFDGAGAGTCLIWHLSYDGEVTGLAMGLNANDLAGCFSLSNNIEVVRSVAGDCQANGGQLIGGPFAFDSVGDGTPDMLEAGSITLANAQGANSQWIITDAQGYILGLPPMPGVVNFDGAGAGTCLIWHLSYDGEVTGLAMGLNANDLAGCFSLSNNIEVVRSVAGDCQANGGELIGGPFAFDSVGDGTPDMLEAGSITLANAQGANSQWIITDAQGYILGLPPMPGVVNFDGAGAGTCLIWHLSYDGEVTGLAMGLNANDLAGCFSLSNNIEVVRSVAGDCQANGGELIGGPFAFDSVGDGTPDMLEAGSITLANAQGMNSQWVVTDDQGNILGLPPMPSVVDFDGAGEGVCLIWHLSYDGEITGAEVGMNANDITGCWSLSNSIEVVRTEAIVCEVAGGTLTGGPFALDSVGDGTPDMLEAGSITLANAQGMNSQWVVTDDQGNILGLPPMPSVVDFDGAGAGVCLIWHLSYDGEITGAEVGMNANDITGCWSLSNSIEVVRTEAILCEVSGGTLAGGPFTFDSVGDGTPDMLEAGSITLANAQGMNSQWVVTDDQGNILGLPPMPSVVDFDGAGEGVCLIWHLSYDGKITGAEVGMNANDITGCWSLSNSIEVVRTEAIVCEVAGGTLTGGPFTFDSVGDGTPDMLEAGSITLANAQGMNSQWVVTDDQGNILGLPPMPSVVDFDSAGEGVCLIWHLSYDGEITGAEVGMNANDITGCWSLSNSIVVTRTEAIVCEVSGGTLTGGPFAFDSVGDGAPDMLEAGAITLANAQGMNSQWVVTDDQGNILGLPPMPSVVDFDGAGAGVCLIWHLSYDGEITGAEVGMNANDITGCWSLSNSIEVTRTEAIVCEVAGGTLAGGPFAFCVGDGEADIIAVDGITLEGNIGTNSQWVITDDQGTILGLPPTFSEVDFDGAPVGTCLVWHLSFEDGLIGAEVELNANDLQGCFSLSNPITVTRDAEGGACGDGAVDDGPAQVVINEIIEGSGVELKNIGSESIDISSYWLCDFPAYDRLDDLVINCGSLLLEPGESITVITDDISVDGDDGEMGLYTSNSFSSSAAIIDYVEWGESGHGRSAVAVGANVWSAGDFVASFASGKSLSYDGEGDAPSDWSETDTTPCEDNGFTERPISDFVKLETLQNPVLDQLVMRITSESPLRKATVDIRNIMGEIVKTMEIDISQNQKLHAVDIADVAAGIYYISIRENYGIVQSTIVKQ